MSVLLQNCNGAVSMQFAVIIGAMHQCWAVEDLYERQLGNGLNLMNKAAVSVIAEQHCSNSMQSTLSIWAVHQFLTAEDWYERQFGNSVNLMGQSCCQCYWRTALVQRPCNLP